MNLTTLSILIAGLPFWGKVGIAGLVFAGTFLLSKEIHWSHKRRSFTKRDLEESFDRVVARSRFPILTPAVLITLLTVWGLSVDMPTTTLGLLVDTTNGIDQRFQIRILGAVQSSLPETTGKVVIRMGFLTSSGFSGLSTFETSPRDLGRVIEEKLLWRSEDTQSPILPAIQAGLEALREEKVLKVILVTDAIQNVGISEKDYTEQQSKLDAVFSPRNLGEMSIDLYGLGRSRDRRIQEAAHSFLVDRLRSAGAQVAIGT